MRIVAGHFRSRTLHSVRDLDLRPTSDRLRETLFNILGERVAGATFLDIFAGTGAVGIEALSRGASHVIFVEKHEATAELIRKNLHALGVSQGVQRIAQRDQEPDEIGAAEVLHTNVGAALKKFAAGGFRADLIFADPPYAEKRLLESSLKFIGNSEILEVGGVFMSEHSSRVSLPEVAGKLRRVRLLEQGDSAISFFSIASGI